MKSKLYESGPVGTVKVDREAGVIRDVKILGRVSKNNRVYSEQAMIDAVRLYEGRRVFFDHNDRKDPRKERKFGDFGGILTNVRREGDGVFADLHYVKADALASKLAESAERFPNSFGLSHNADGVTRRDRETLIVEGLVDVESVDIVTRPAAVEGLFESQDLEEEKNMNKKTTLREVIETHFPATAKTCGLMEMDGMPAMPIDVPAEASTEDTIWAAFKQAINAALDDDALDIKATLKKIGEILKAYDKLTGTADNKQAEAPAPDAVAESLNAIRLIAETAERRSLACQACAERSVTPTAALIEELVKLPNATAMSERLATEQPAKRRPNVSALRESESHETTLPKTSAELAAMLR